MGSNEVAGFLIRVMRTTFGAAATELEYTVAAQTDYRTDVAEPHIHAPLRGSNEIPIQYC